MLNNYITYVTGKKKKKLSLKLYAEEYRYNYKNVMTNLPPPV